MAKAKSPKFHRPPVVEAFCGIQFQELRDLHAPQLGKLWDKFRRRYPLIETQPPLLNAPPGIPTIVFGPTLQFRTWFTSEDRTIVVQVQRDRLIVNWRRQEDADAYPSFDVLQRNFASVFSQFKDFVSAIDMGELRFTGLEFGYVNVIPIAEEFSSTQDVADIFPILGFGKPGSILGSMSALNFQAQFNLPIEGQLHLTIQSAQRPTDGQPVLRCDLVSKWSSPQIKESAVLPWLSSAHEQTVDTFVSITSAKMQKLDWSRYQ